MPDRQEDLAERIVHLVDQAVAVVRQIQDDRIGVDVLDYLDLPLGPAHLLTASLVMLKHSEKLGELGDQVDSPFSPYLRVALEAAEHVALRVDTHRVLYADVGTLGLEVRLDAVDGQAVRRVEVGKFHLLARVQAGHLDIPVGYLGLLRGEGLGLVGGKDAGRTVDARHRAHDLGEVTSAGVDQVRHDRLRPGFRLGERYSSERRIHDPS